MRGISSLFAILNPSRLFIRSSSSSYLITRNWIPSSVNLVSGSSSSTLTSSPDLLSIISYNILCQKYISPFHFHNCPKQFKEQDYRHYLLKMEIEQLGDVDAFAFQEVSPDYFQILLPEMEKRGYAGWYLKKSEAGIDGLATFWRTSRFELVGKKECHLDELAKMLPFPPGESAASSSFSLLYHIVSQFSILQMKDSGRRFVFGNVHIYYDWKRNDLQALEIAQTIRELSKYSKENGDLPFLLCGDFNIRPDTPAYQLMRKGSWQPEEWKKGEIVGLLKDEKMIFLPEVFESEYNHPVTTLQSAYNTILGSEPSFTNYTNHFVGCLDYILYTSDSLQPIQVLQLPEASELKPFGGCPNQKFPSDHLSIGAKFRLSQTS